MTLYVQQRIETNWYLDVTANPGGSDCTINFIKPDHVLGSRPPHVGEYRLVEGNHREVLKVELTDTDSRVTRTLTVLNPKHVFDYGTHD